jgi:hypothetical protein
MTPASEVGHLFLPPLLGLPLLLSHCTKDHVQISAIMDSGHAVRPRTRVLAILSQAPSK